MVNAGTIKHQETLHRSVTHFSSQNYNLLPKIIELAPKVEAEITIQSVAELEDIPELDQSDPVPLPVFSDGAQGQRQGREQRDAERMSEASDTRVSSVSESVRDPPPPVEMRQPSNRDSQPESPNIDLSQQNIEPYDVLFQTETQLEAALPPRQETTEDTVDSLQRQLADARQENAAKDRIIEVSILIIYTFNL